MVDISLSEKNRLCMELGKHICKLREILGMSQTEFGERCGISKPRLSVIENGHHMMSWSQYMSVVLLCVINRKTKEYLCLNKIITIALLQYFQQCDNNISPDFNTGLDKEILVSGFAVGDESAKDEYLLMIEREQILNTTSKDTLFDYEVQTDTFRYSYTDKNGKLRSNEIVHYVQEERYKDTVHPDSIIACAKIIDAILSGPVSGTLEYMTKLTYDGYRWNRLIYKSITDANGKVSHVYGQIENLHELLTEKSNAEMRASLDLMTGTLNKVSAQNEIEEIISGKTTSKSAFLMIDIDNLKHINDSRGHIWGDNALKQFASLLQRVFSADDIIGRFGGDEFVVFMKSVPLDIVKSKIEAFRKHLAEMEGDALTCSMGIVYVNNRQISFDELLRNADSAMYEIKRSGKNGYLIREV